MVNMIMNPKTITCQTLIRHDSETVLQISKTIQFQRQYLNCVIQRNWNPDKLLAFLYRIWLNPAFLGQCILNSFCSINILFVQTYQYIFYIKSVREQFLRHTMGRETTDRRLYLVLYSCLHASSACSICMQHAAS